MTFVDDPRHHRSNSLRRWCLLATATEFALHAKNNGLPLAPEEKIVNYKQLGFVSSTSLSYKYVTIDVKGAGRGTRVMMAATESGEAAAARILGPEQKPNSLLRYLMLCFS